MAEATATPDDTPIRAFLRDYGVFAVVGMALLAVGLTGQFRARGPVAFHRPARDAQTTHLLRPPTDPLA